MPTQANHYLILTDGTDTATFADGVGGATAFKLQSDWSPSVAQLRRSAMGGRGPYDDVVENWPFSVSGSTPAAATANLALLNRLMENAERFERGEVGSPVLVKFAPLGSTVAASGSPYQARVLGYAGGATLNLGNRYFDAPVAVSAGAYRINGLYLRFARQGTWLFGTDAVAAASANNGELITFTMAETLANPGPIAVSITNFGLGKTGGNRYHGGFLLVGETPGGGSAPMTIINAETMASGAFTSVADSGRNARNTNVLRYTPTGAAETSSATITGTVPSGTELVAVFANIRPSATVSFRVRLRLDTLLWNQFTPALAIPAVTTQYPLWRFLGLAAAKGPNFSATLAVTAGAASSNLDIDTIVLADARTVQALGLVGPGDLDLNSALYNSTLTIDHRLLTKPDPAALLLSMPVPYLGDPVFALREGTLYGLLLVTGGGTGTDGDEWRQANVSSDAVFANVMTLTRTKSYLVPE